MTNEHNPHMAGRCVICQQRPAWAPRSVCLRCYRQLRADLVELAEVDEWLGECMTALPSTWRQHTIHAHPTEAPAPMPLHLADARARVSECAWYWVVMVRDAKRPRPAPPRGESVRAATKWLAAHLWWIVRQSAVKQFAEDVHRQIERAGRTAPRPADREDLPLPCPADGCGLLSLSLYGGWSEGLVVCRVCRFVMTLRVYGELAAAPTTGRAA